MTERDSLMGAPLFVRVLEVVSAGEALMKIVECSMGGTSFSKNESHGVEHFYFTLSVSDLASQRQGTLLMPDCLVVPAKSACG